MPGRFKGKDVTIGDVFEAVGEHNVGKLSDQELHELECVACHEGFKPDQLPHAKKITQVKCQNCHDGEQFEKYQKSVHAVADVQCSACHSTHDIRKLSSADPAMRKEFAHEVCATCHTDQDAKFMESDHGRALAAGGLRSR